MTELERWKGDEAGKARWEKFINTPEFKRGMDVLKSHAVPMAYVSEPFEAAAKRQFWQAGFFHALFLLQNMHQLHYKKIVEQALEWDYLSQDETSNQPLNKENV